MIDPLMNEESSVNTSDRVLRQFAGLWLLFLGSVACYQQLVHERTNVALICAGLAVLGPLGVIWPRIIRPVFVTLMAITYPIGWVVSHILLGLLFYGVFTPVALFFRLIGRDALGRQRSASQATYWTPKPMATDLRSYLRQS